MQWEYFSLDEFRCPCCGVVDIEPSFVEKLDKLRRDAGFAFIVTSGYRCAKHNQAVGGAPNSAHRLGRAADIAIDGTQMGLLMDLRLTTDYGFYGFGISQKRQLRMLHLDDMTPSELKYRPIAWSY